MRAGSVRAAAVVMALLMLATVIGPATGASPGSGTLTDTQRSLAYTGGPFVAPNRTDPINGDGSTQQCAPEVLPCDDFALTVRLPAGFLRLHPDARVRVALTADNGTSDYDLYVLDSSGAYVAVGYNAGGSESVEFAVVDGTHVFTIRAVPYSSNAASYSAKVQLLAADPTRDTDRDKVVDVKDWCPMTPKGVKVDRNGCPLKPISLPSAPSRPRVVVADLDSAINPYHEFYYRRPSTVTREVLAELGVKPQNVVRLTRTGNFASDIAADAGFWARVKRGELYHFVGTNIIATSLANTGPWLKPTTAKNPHGVGTSAAVLEANPDAIIFFIEANDALGSAETHARAFQHPAVDIVTTSYGVSLASGLLPAPEWRAFEHSYEGVVERGKLHFSSGGNGPGITATRAGAGPWWSIGVSGIEEHDSNGDTALSGNFPDFVSDFTQDLPYCMDCESGRASVSGTSFSTPRSAGIASRVLLEARRKLGHAGGIRWLKGTPAMATDAPTGRAAASCGVSITCESITNWEVRRALEQAAWVPQAVDYDPTQASGGGVGLPIVPGTPWLQTAWGDLTTDPTKGVHGAAMAELGLGGIPRHKPTGFCEFQTSVVLARKAWWDNVAPNLPENPIAPGETPPGTPPDDPFIYCQMAAP
jgi:hypothetical protein